MQVELGREGFLFQAAGKLSSLGKYDPGNAAKVPESSGQEHAERAPGEAWAGQGAAIPCTPHFP